ncbi:MAG: SPFH/Band 7/PHB domain protein [Acidimicrobiales bacterium]|nr:SPFH/Band 7/PHB domain protein [Acidimicrobiales bacterium]
MFIYVVLAVIVMVIFLFLIAGMKIVRPYERGIVERVGKYKETKESGLQIIIPFIDTIKRVDMREQVVDVPPQEVITSDNVVVSVDAVVFYEPTDPQRLVYNIANFVLAITKLAQTNLRNLVGELQLDGALTSRDRINATLREILDEATDKWGVRVVRVEIQRIDPPPDVMAAMHEQMKAERTRRATVTEAEGFRESEITRAEGDKQSRILEAEGQRRSAILAAEGEAQAVRTVAEAERYRLQTVAEGEAEATRQIFQAIHDGDPTSDLLAVRYIDALGQIADGRATKIVVPTEFSGVLGAVMGIAEAMRPVVDTDTDTDTESSTASASEDLNLE